MSDHRIKYKCVFCPSLITTYKSPLQSEVYEARNLLRTCRQIRHEGKRVFYEVNTWILSRARLSKSQVRSSETAQDTQMVFDQLRGIDAMQHFKHVGMQTTLSPLVYCDLPLPENLTLDSTTAIDLFDQSHHPNILNIHKLDEVAQCELYKLSFQKFVENQKQVFPNLKSVGVEVSLHPKRMILGVHDSPMNRCGITLYIRIKLECGESATPSCKEPSLPVLAPNNVTHNTQSLPRATGQADNQSLSPGTISPSQIDPRLDPRRYMLSPLIQLLGVQSVEVERLWTVHYHPKVIGDEIASERKQPLRQLWRFCTVGEMLWRAGPWLLGFLDPALEYLGITINEVIEIIENTIEDVGHPLVP